MTLLHRKASLLILLVKICLAATQGKWKLPKHVGLSVTARHLF